MDVVWIPACLLERLAHLGDADIVHQYVSHIHVAIVVFLGEDGPAGDHVGSRHGCSGSALGRRGRQRSWRDHTPKPHAEVVGARWDGVAIGRADAALPVPPATPAQHVAVSLCRAGGICLCRREIVPILVQYPLPHISGHVQYTAPTRPGRETPHWGGVVVAIVTLGEIIPKVASCTIEPVSPRVDASFRPSCRVLPLRLGRQSAASPGAIVRRILPRNTRYGIVIPIVGRIVREARFPTVPIFYAKRVLGVGHLGAIHPKAVESDRVLGRFIFVRPALAIDLINEHLFTLRRDSVNLGVGTAHQELAARNIDHRHPISGTDSDIAQGGHRRLGRCRCRRWRDWGNGRRDWYHRGLSFSTTDEQGQNNHYCSNYVDVPSDATNRHFLSFHSLGEITHRNPT